MKISRQLLAKAVDAKILSKDQARDLFQFLEHQDPQTPSLNMTNVLYYFGGLIAIGAMTLFMNLGWEAFGGWGIFFLSLVYALIGLYLASYFKKKNYPIPAGICATFVIALTPLAIYGLQRAFGFWPDDISYRSYHIWIKWYWVYMEIGTLIVGLILAWVYRYPFMIMPIALTLWYMSMDFAALLTVNDPSWQLNSQISMYFGLITLIIAFWTDLRSRQTKDYAFWLYLFGVLTFWGGLSMQHSESELSKLLYFCINLILIGTGVILMRKVFLVFGALGCCLYLGHLAATFFKDSLLFPFALTLIGFAIIYLGILWQKHEHQIIKKVQALLPKAVRELLEQRH